MTAATRLIAVLCCLLLAVSMAVTVGAATTADTGGQVSVVSSVEAEWGPTQLEPAANESDENETTHHKDPSNVSEGGSLSDVKQWLVGSMAERLGDSAINLSQGQYQFARSILGEDFGDDLDRYVNVAGDTATDGDDDTADTFTDTREKQQTLANETEQFQRTYEEYQAAREAGDTSRARELAKRLDRMASRINETSGDLLENYDALSNATGESFEAAEDAIRNTTASVRDRAEDVVATTLVRTELEIRRVSSNASFTDPLTIEGRSVAANGSGLGGIPITLDVPGAQPTVRTAPDGEFSLTYRPVLLETGTQSLTVRATPAGSSVFQPAATTVTTSIEAVDPTLTVSGAPDRVAFGDRLAVNATVTVDDRPVPNVPVRLDLAGTALSSARTGVDGQLTMAGHVPASVADGAATLTARLDMDGRAIATTTVTRNVDVEETTTELTIETHNGTTLGVAGTLETTEGMAVSGHPVRIQVDGAGATTATTNASGGFSTNLGQAVVPPNETVTVTASFEAPSSNLAPSQANATGIRLPSTSNEDGDETTVGATPGDGATGGDGGSSLLSMDRLSSPLVIAGTLLAVVLLVGGVYVWHERDAGGSSAEETAAATGSQERAPDSSATDPFGDVEPTLDADGADAAAVVLYETIFDVIPVERRADLTPRERYRTVRGSLTEAQAQTLERVTDLHEQAVFAPGAVSPEHLRDVLGAVRSGFEDLE